VLGCDEATVSRHLLLLIDEKFIGLEELHVPNRKARRFKFLRAIWLAPAF